jgi:hypothetical protein
MDRPLPENCEKIYFKCINDTTGAEEVIEFSS